MAKKLRIEYQVVPDAATLAARRPSSSRKRQRKPSERGRARIAISGGSTPKAAFALLADPGQPWRSRMPWDKLELFWVDERCVPPDDADSNYRMTREAMLDQVPLKPEQVHRMEGELEPAGSGCALRVAAPEQLSPGRRREPALRPGGAGHGSRWAHRFPLPAYRGAPRNGPAGDGQPRAPQKDTWRITLTWPVINNASSVFFLIGGADKAQVLKEVLTGPRDPERLAQSTDMALKRYTHSDSGSGCCCAFARNRWGRLRGFGEGTMILAGDVGGTKVHLALYDFTDGKLTHTRDERYAAKEYNGLEEIVKEFLGAETVTSACFGVPGPVRDGRLRLTNLPWTLDSRELSAGLGHSARVSDQRPRSQRLRHRRAVRRPDLHPERGRSRARLATAR